MPITNRVLTPFGVQAIMPDNGIKCATHKGNFPIPQLPKTATTCHEIPGLRDALFSIPQLADQGYTITFDKTKMNVYPDNMAQQVLAPLQPHSILDGYRDYTSGLWRIPLSTQPVQALSRPNYQRMHSVYHQRNKAELARFLHATAGSPVPSTFITAINQGFYTSWPGLTADLIRTHLPKSEATVKGHLDRQRQFARST